MEHLDCNEGSEYDAYEAAIYLNRYLIAQQFVSGKRVLDVACGEGYGCKLMKDWGAANVIGVDISENALNVAKQRVHDENVSFICHSAEDLPFANDSFDVVVSFGAIEFLEQPELFLSELARVVCCDGVVILSCPNDEYYAQNDEEFGDVLYRHKYNWFEIKNLSEKYLGPNAAWLFGFGLQGVSSVPYCSITLPDGKQPPNTMDALFEYSVPTVSGMLQAQRCISYWNASYYLGIWGLRSEEIPSSVVFFPEEVFADYSSSDYNALETEVKSEIELLKSILADKDRQLHTIKIEKDRTANLLRLANEEKRYLWERIDGLQIELNRIKKGRAFRFFSKVRALKKKLKSAVRSLKKRFSI